MRITILVAVYNAERTLPKCLDSLLAQTYHDIEIIAANDASTDKSADILDEYRQRDNRIHVVSRPRNGGSAKARNSALAKATGDAIMFVDSDDWISPDAVEKVVETYAAHPLTDSVLLDCHIVDDNGTEEIYPLPDFDVLDGATAFEKSLNWEIHGMYAVRADIHKAHPYDDTRKTYSDDTTTRIHYLFSREVRRCQGIYYYYQHAASVCHVVNENKFHQIGAADSLKRQMIAYGVDKRLIRQHETTRWLVLIACYDYYFANRRRLSAEARQFGRDEMRRSWNDIERPLLDTKLTRRFGYHPMSHWWAFRVQEECFFSLKTVYYGIRRLLRHR